MQSLKNRMLTCKAFLVTVVAVDLSFEHPNYVWDSSLSLKNTTKKEPTAIQRHSFSQELPLHVKREDNNSFFVTIIMVCHSDMIHVIF